jgi:hypothetical protein
MIRAICLLAATLLVAPGCSQPRSAATDHPSASLPEKQPSGELPVIASASASAEPAQTPPHEPTQPVSAAPSPAAELPTKLAPPPADRGPTRPGEAEKITFEDLNLGMQADIVFREFMLTDRVKDLQERRVSIIGYMHGGQATQRGIKDFILLKNTQCKFGPGGQADHLANIVLREGATTSFSPSPVKVEGTLKIRPFIGPDGNTWSIFRLEDAQIR